MSGVTAPASNSLSLTGYVTYSPDSGPVTLAFTYDNSGTDTPITTSIGTGSMSADIT